MQSSFPLAELYGSFCVSNQSTASVFPRDQPATMDGKISVTLSFH